MGASPAPYVAVVQRVLPHYRVAFFDRLEKGLREQAGVGLLVISGQEAPGTVPGSEKVDRTWSWAIRNRYVRVGGAEVVWQPCLGVALGAELVVVEQASRLLVNYPLLAARASGMVRLAFWGHGRNFQSGEGGLGKGWRRRLINSVDWWFAYTERSASVVKAAGFPEARITTVNNAIDTGELIEAAARIEATDLAVLRRGLGIHGRHVGVYCGGIYPDKHPEFLVKVADRIRAEVPDFHLVVVGSGPSSGIIVSASATRPWVHYVGPLFGQARVPYLLLGGAFLMPGAVGLAILDSFALRRPLFTTDVGVHGPEIAYLESGKNGVMTQATVEDFSGAVARYFHDPEEQERLRTGCAESAQAYTLGAMVDRFTDGIVRAMAA